MIVSDTEWADMQRALAYNEKQNAKLVEGICLLGDTLMTLFPEWTRIEPGMEPAARPLKNVLESAALLCAAYVPEEGVFEDMSWEAADDLHAALKHPVIATLLDAWATKEG